MRLQIQRPVYGGAGLAQSDGEHGGKRAVFVPFTLPGELVEAEVGAGAGNREETALLQVLAASKERVAPGCEHFVFCGGCQYQHASYEAQVAMKLAILEETLERAGLQELPMIKPHIAEPWGYRNRIRLRIAERDGVLRVGYNMRGTAEFLAIRECPIAAPLLWRAVEVLCELGEEGAGPFRALLKEAVEVEFLCDGDERRLQMALFLRRRMVGSFSAFCEQMKSLIPELLGAGLVQLKGEEGGGRGGRRVQRTETLAEWGAAGLNYKVAGREYWVARGGFFQVNRFLVEEMLRLVTGGRKGLLAWDLYAGVGLFSRVLTENFKQVVAVEGGEVASAELVRAMQMLGKKGVRASAEEFLQAAVVQRERPELVVVDPPRAGLGAQVCALLARVAPKELVYVSCDPVTLARDLKKLVDSGYRMVQVHMIDMFPQTFHIETMVVLQR